MKKICSISIICFLCFLVTVPLFSNDVKAFEATSEHYKIYSEVSAEHANETAKKMEALFRFFNSYFHFNEDLLPVKLNVRIFSEKERYNTYLERIISQKRDDFTYLHYSDKTRCELAGYHMEDEEFNISLTHQGFIQFLRAFIENPPLWFREGFAVFFEKSKYNPKFDKIVYKENLAWLETLQSYLNEETEKYLIPLTEILEMDIEAARKKIEIFYPQSWGMISFLINSWNKEYNRLLWDTISAIDPHASMEENVRNIKQKTITWVDKNQIAQDFVKYINSKKSFRGLVNEGIDLYSQGLYNLAEESFVKASKLNEDNFVPYYYLGLIHYAKENYSLADYYYKEALDKGSNSALTYYALGVNAFANSQYEEAKKYLTKTKELNPEKYGEKSDKLLKRIENL